MSTLEEHLQEYHLLWIPVDGPVHLRHDHVVPDDKYVKKVLAEFNSMEVDTIPAKIEAKIDDTEAVIWFTPNPNLPENARARAFIVDTFGWHLVFHGCVVIDGLQPETVARFIAATT